MFYNPTQTQEINAALDRWITEEEEEGEQSSHELLLTQHELASP